MPLHRGMEEMLRSVSASDAAGRFPTVRRVVAAFTVGEKVAQKTTCQYLFPCRAVEVEVVFIPTASYEH